MTEDLKAAIERLKTQIRPHDEIWDGLDPEQLHKRGEQQYLKISPNDGKLLINAATRHSDNVEAGTDEKRKAALDYLENQTYVCHDRTEIYMNTIIPVNIIKTIKSALKQPDKTVEVLKGVRDGLRDLERLIYPYTSVNLEKQLTALSGVIDGGE